VTLNLRDPLSRESFRAAHAAEAVAANDDIFQVVAPAHLAFDTSGIRSFRLEGV
jgi:hypothetical protein